MPEFNHDQLLIQTPEGVQFALPLAGPLTRFLAWGIDLAATIVIVMFMSVVLNALAIILPDVASGLMIVLFFAVNIGYSIVLEWLWRGQTLGKRLLHLRVMDVQGLRLQFSQIVLRNLLRVLDAIPVLYLVGGVALLLSRYNQRLGDLAANTVVVFHRPAPPPDVSQILPDKYNSFTAWPHIEARLRQRISPAETALLIQALMRRGELEPQARVTLYRELAGRLRELAPFPEEATATLTDEQYLRNAVDSLFRGTRRASAAAAGRG